MKDESEKAGVSLPPAPRLLAGHLLRDRFEVDALIHSDGCKNLYLVRSEMEEMLLLECHVEGFEAREIPESCLDWFPPVVETFTLDGRAYLVFGRPPGRPLSQVELDCWEPLVLELLLRLLEGLRDLDGAGLSLAAMHPSDPWLAEDRLCFVIFPTARTDTDSSGEPAHRLLREILFNRLIAKVTRNLEKPLACLGLSSSLEQLLQTFLARQISWLELLEKLQSSRRQPRPHWDIEAITHTGMVRDHNEDACGFMTSQLLTSRGDRGILLLAVSDGMGGHLRGEVASHFALHHWFKNMLANTVASPMESWSNPALKDLLARSFDDTEASVLREEELVRDSFMAPEFRPGATLVAGLLMDRLLFLGSCGDSRAYLVNDSGIKRLTKDHSLVQLFVDRGSLTEEEAFQHDQSNVITSFIGIEPKAFLRNIYVYRLDWGDTLLLCSDGVTDMIPDREIHQLVRAAPDARTAAARLVDLANENGGGDNISVVIAKDRANQLGGLSELARQTSRVDEEAESPKEKA